MALSRFRAEQPHKNVNWGALTAIVTFFLASVPARMPSRYVAGAQAIRIQAVPGAKSWLGSLREFHNANALTPQCA
jgi:hypothetical protein